MPATDQSRLHQHVAFLASLSPARNYRNLESLNRAADYIKQELQQLSGTVTEQAFVADGRRYRNIIASFGPPDAARIIVGAHYDVDGDQPGADDNASAVAGMLETARLLHQRQPELRYRFDFVAYPNEEQPYAATEYMGSAVHARSLHAAGAAVRLMVCYEMIGYFSDLPGSQHFPDPALAARYPHVGNFIIVLGKTGQEPITHHVQHHMQAHAGGLDVQQISLPESLPLAMLSDHRNYWAHGYEAVMISDTSFLRNPHYHQPTDTIDTLDFARMAQVVEGVYGALLAL